MSVNAEKPVPIYLKRFPNKKKVVRIPMVGERPSNSNMLEIPLPKSETLAYLTSALKKLSNDESLSPMELGVVQLLLELTITEDGFSKFCTAFDLYENKSGRAKEYHFKGGAFILIVLMVFGEFPIKQLVSSQLCSLLGFKTSEGEDVQSQVYRMKKEFMDYALYKEDTAFQLKQQKLNTALFESMQFFLALEPAISDSQTKKLYNEIVSKFKDIDIGTLNTISSRILNDQNTLDVLVVK
ncbi:hypothetical protein [Vibrio parahaemolyticus]|uniref:hypothetical protein n=1 Tax=Vibrio parahaemolyticus TaxID=670 RepID=UPI00040DFCD2|nr:hypothetical protein [Vibrio parahaemolyticus]